MTRKDFQVIADALKYAMPSKVAMPTGFQHRMNAWRNTVFVMADYLATTNDRFDRARFCKACGIED